jgi:hypothetical protein
MARKNREDDSANDRNSTLDDAGASRAKRELIRATASSQH